jgi:hypothetical protein
MYAELPRDVRVNANRAYQLFRRDPGHPSLRFKKLTNQENLYSARIGLGYRALAQMDGDDLIWFWIGPHSLYDKLLNG